MKLKIDGEGAAGWRLGERQAHDEDGGIRDREWQWYRGGASDVADDSSLQALSADADACWERHAATAIAALYTPRSPSTYATTCVLTVGSSIHLVVTYTDAFDSDNAMRHDGRRKRRLVARPTRAVQAPPTTNDAPKFGIQDREIDGDDAAPESVMRTRDVDEGTKAVGNFMATDDRLLTFELGGADGGLLSGPSEENSVSLSLKAAPDFENPADYADGDNAYEVSITAKDPSGATDTLMVTVMVDDIDDKPVAWLRP